MTPSYAEMIAVLENSQSVNSIGLTEKRIDTLLGALRMAHALTAEPGCSIVFTIPYQRIADIVCTALESPVGGWLIKAKTGMVSDRAGITRVDGPWYSQGAYWSRPDAALTCTVDNPEWGKQGQAENFQKRLTMEDFQRALCLLATKDDGAYAHHLGNFLGENDDAMTADIFMQMAVYGEEVFA